VSDTVRVNEADLAGKVKEYLQKAAMTNDFILKEKALYGLAWRELYREGSWWREEVWDEKASDYVWKTNRQSPQYRAFSGLADLEKQNATQTSKYVSRCDEFIQFKKQYR
jgi:hypothetical protein